MALNYSTYLKLDELLALQLPQSQSGDSRGEQDEMLFIIIHQNYELWFKLMLHEMQYLCERLDQDDIGSAQQTLKRILTVLKVMVSQMDIIETMTPTNFSKFRHRLDSASGFQSTQFRQIEFMLGYKREEVLENVEKGSRDYLALEDAYRSRTLWDAFIGYLSRRDIQVPKKELERDVSKQLTECAELQEALISAYKSDYITQEFCERLVDLDEGLQEWRYRHVKLVQRTIGSKMGTGGSAGAQYLASTLSRPFFPDLWAIRSEL